MPPSRATSRAVASPIPDEAPVIITTRPASGLEDDPVRVRTTRRTCATGLWNSKLMDER
jgi:hypothetical protein